MELAPRTRRREHCTATSLSWSATPDRRRWGSPWARSASRAHRDRSSRAGECPQIGDRAAAQPHRRV